MARNDKRKARKIFQARADVRAIIAKDCNSAHAGVRREARKIANAVYCRS